MNWKTLDHLDQLQEIVDQSKEEPVMIFKHSTRCAISSLALNRLEREWNLQDATAYFLDLIRYRDISNEIASMFDVYHQSPQVLIIANGESIYDDSHMGISYKEIEKRFDVASAS